MGALEARATAEIALTAARHAHERLEDVLDCMNNPFCIYGPNWEFMQFNRAAAEMMHAGGLDPNALIGKALWDVMPDINGTDIETQLRRVAVERVPAVLPWQMQSDPQVHLQIYAFPTRDGVATYTVDVSATVLAEQRLRYLAEASEVLASSLSLRETLAHVAALVVPRIADAFTLDLLDENGRPKRYATDYASSELAEAMREMSAPVPIAEVDVLPGVSNPEHLEKIRQLVLTSIIIVPLQGRGQTIGTLTIGSVGDRRLNERDLELARELAHRIAVAVENARLLDAARESKDALRTPLEVIAKDLGKVASGLQDILPPEEYDHVLRIQQSQEQILALIDDLLNPAE